jgi:hypothetical protein
MSIASLPPIVDERFSMATGTDDSRPLLRIAGDADIAAQALVGPFLRRLHVELRESQTGAVLVDLRELQFINSSCIKALVSWIAEVVNLAVDQRYRVIFCSNPAYRWQQRTLKTLQAFAPGVVEIDTADSRFDTRPLALSAPVGAPAQCSIAP